MSQIDQWECPCGARSPMSAAFCRQCGGSRAHGRRIAGIPPYTPAQKAAQQRAGVLALVVLLGFVVFVVAQLYSIGAENRWFDPKPAAGYAANSERVQYGMTMQQVLAVCGPPRHDQRTEVGGANTGLPYSWQNYLYYDGGYQLCFQDGKLVSINRY